MTTRTATSNQRKSRKPWHTLGDWLHVLDESLNFDPHEYTNSVVRILSEKVAQLEARVIELEAQTTANGGQ